MKCLKPFHKGDNIFPCGQCMLCRINRRRLWSHRIMLETLKHERNCFVTLTYSDEYLKSDSLVPKDTQDWLKRLRKLIYPLKIRYYLVGEYGDITERPHYHAAIFGLGEEDTDVIARSWPFGHVMVGSLTLQSAAYIAGYVTKKMTAKDDPRLNGRLPEFSRMSLRPGIGADAMDDVADSLLHITDDGEVLYPSEAPNALNHGGRSLPLGRYLKGKLNEKLNLPNLGFESPYLQAQREELRTLYKDKKITDPLSKKILVQYKNAQKNRNAIAKAKLFKSRKTL